MAITSRTAGVDVAMGETVTKKNQYMSHELAASMVELKRSIAELKASMDRMRLYQKFNNLGHCDHQTRKRNEENQGNNHTLQSPSYEIRDSNSCTRFVGDLRNTTVNDSNIEVKSEKTCNAHKVFDKMPAVRILKQEGTVEEYYAEFSSFFGKTSLYESFDIGLFIWGLKPEIKERLMFEPKTLSDALCLAKLHETTNNLMKNRYGIHLIDNKVCYDKPILVKDHDIELTVQVEKDILEEEILEVQVSLKYDVKDGAKSIKQQESEMNENEEKEIEEHFQIQTSILESKEINDDKLLEIHQPDVQNSEKEKIVEFNDAQMQQIFDDEQPNFSDEQAVITIVVEECSRKEDVSLIGDLLNKDHNEDKKSIEVVIGCESDQEHVVDHVRPYFLPEKRQFSEFSDSKVSSVAAFESENKSFEDDGRNKVVGSVSGLLVQQYIGGPNKENFAIYTEFTPMIGPSFKPVIWDKAVAGSGMAAVWLEIYGAYGFKYRNPSYKDDGNQECHQTGHVLSPFTYRVDTPNSFIPSCHIEQLCAELIHQHQVVHILNSFIPIQLKFWAAAFTRILEDKNLLRGMDGMVQIMSREEHASGSIYKFLHSRYDLLVQGVNCFGVESCYETVLPIHIRNNVDFKASQHGVQRKVDSNFLSLGIGATEKSISDKLKETASVDLKRAHDRRVVGQTLSTDFVGSHRINRAVMGGLMTTILNTNGDVCAIKKDGLLTKSLNLMFGINLMEMLLSSCMKT